MLYPCIVKWPILTQTLFSSTILIPRSVTLWRLPYRLNTYCAIISLCTDLAMDWATALALALACKRKRNTKKKQTKWVKQSFLQCQRLGYSKLLEKLRNIEPVDHKNFLRMDGRFFWRTVSPECICLVLQFFFHAFLEVIGVFV